jgi:hypothetical protein
MENSVIVWRLCLASVMIVAALFCLVVMNLSSKEVKTLKEQIQIVNLSNLHLTNLLASKDPLAFQTIQAASQQPSTFNSEPYIPMDDSSELQRWSESNGLGLPLYDEDPDGDAGRAALIGHE